MRDDTLADRMKYFERVGAGHDKMDPDCPVVVRLDGRAFSSFTKGLERPYDARLSQLMIETTKYLVQLTNACIGYTCSDEITLILFSDRAEGQVYFDGRRDKLNSILAAQCSVFFNEELANYIPEKYMLEGMKRIYDFPVFDCRAWSVPSKADACSVLIWRENDCIRNSIQTAGQTYYSHKELDCINCNQIKTMLIDKGIYWNDYPIFYKRGTYYQRTTIARPFTTEEISLLPAKHEARTNPDLLVKRRTYDSVDMPRITKVSNLEAVIFKGKKPEIYDAESI